MFPTEYVAYADTNITFDTAYPRYLGDLVSGFYTVSDGEYYFTYWSELAVDSFTGSVATLSSGGTVATEFPDLVGNNILAVLLASRGSTTFSREVASSELGVCYYVFRDVPGNQAYIRLTQSDLSSSWSNNLSSTFDVPSDPINFLYSFGTQLVNTSDTVFSVLSYNIGGVSFLSLLFGAGFLFLMGVLILKWVVPWR